MAALAAVEQREVDLQTQLAHSMGAVLVGSLIAMLYVSFFLLAFLGSLSAHLPYPAQSLWRSLDAGLPLLATLSKGYSPNEVHGRPAISFLLSTLGVDYHGTHSRSCSFGMSLPILLRNSPCSTTVLSFRSLDTLHSAMTMTANWQYLINNFGEWDTIDEITWSVLPTTSSSAFAHSPRHSGRSRYVHLLIDCPLIS